MSGARQRLCRLALAAALSAIVPIAGGCNQATAGGTVTPGDGEPRPGADPQGAHMGDSLGELKLRLEQLKRRQLQVIPAANQDKAVCEDVCSLATSICGVAEKLCNLADDHPQDPEYQNLCREARLECKEAQDSCIGCVEGHTTQPETSGIAPE